MMKTTPLFADVLMGAMMDADVNCSGLARRVWGTIKDTRGYNVARNRDRVGHYLRNKSYPNPANLTKIAAALGVPVAELASARRPDQRGRTITVRSPKRLDVIEARLDRIEALLVDIALKLDGIILAQSAAAKKVGNNRETRPEQQTNASVALIFRFPFEKLGNSGKQGPD